MIDYFIFAAIFFASAYGALLVHTAIGNTDYGIEWFAAMAYAGLFAVFLAICCIAWTAIRCIAWGYLT